jgi:hypothetical protein
MKRGYCLMARVAAVPQVEAANNIVQGEVALTEKTLQARIRHLRT